MIWMGNQWFNASLFYAMLKDILWWNWWVYAMFIIWSIFRILKDLYSKDDAMIIWQEMEEMIMLLVILILRTSIYINLRFQDDLGLLPFKQV